MFKNNVCSGHCTNKTELDLADRRKNKTSTVEFDRNLLFFNNKMPLCVCCLCIVLAGVTKTSTKMG